MKTFIIKHYPLLLLFVLTLIVAATNYTPGTFLSGWDNLHPEFNFSLNIKRSIFAVWQEYQGLGLLGGMAHASDLPRQIVLWLVSFVLPKDLIRYAYHFSMVFIGMAGVYATLKRFFLSEKKLHIAIIASLLGAVFYLLNLGTIQYFFVPFEPYSTFWGFFPWEIFALLLFLEHPSKRRAFLLFLINFFAIPQAYVQTIFFVYIICLCVILAFWAIKTKKKASIFIGSKIILLIFFINSFWLLPNLYFVFHDVSVTQNSMQNQMATEKFFQMNQKRGTITDFPILREFYYDFFYYNNSQGHFDYLMSTWRDHFSSPAVLAAGYLLFILILWGLMQKNRYRFVIFPLFIISALVFLSDTIPFSFLNSLLRESSLINQIFRNPFTKFIVPTVFVFSLSFGLGTASIINFAEKKGHKKITSFITGGIFLLILLTSFPVFTGNFISPSMRVKIPKDYFLLFDYFKIQDPNGKIMNLPQDDYWGWTYYRFGEQGSGFLWYGIEQPILDRAFDVWSPTLENYYWELSYAIQKRDKTLFNQVIKKYQISYVLFDKNIMLVNDRNSERTISEENDLLQNNPMITKAKSFGNLTLYKTQFSKNNQNVSFSHNLPSVSLPEKFMDNDRAFSTFGTYYTPQNKNSADIIFPYGSLFTQRFQNDKSFSVKEYFTNFSLDANLPSGTFTANLPDLFSKETIIPTDVYAKREGGQLFLRFIVNSPKITLGKNSLPFDSKQKDFSIYLDSSLNKVPLVLAINNNEYFIVDNSSEFNKIGSTYLLTNNIANYFNLYAETPTNMQILPAEDFQKAKDCSTGNEKNSSFSSNTAGGELILKAKNSAICSVYNQQIFIPKTSLIQTTFTYTSLSDEYPKYCFFDDTTKTCDNKKDLLHYGFSNQPRTFTDYFETTSETSGAFNIILEANADEDINKTKQIIYKNISLTSYPLINGGIINLDTIGTEKKITANIPKNSTIQAFIPKIENSNFSQTNTISNNLYKTTPLNYDYLMPGNFYLDEKSDDGKALQTRAIDSSSYLSLHAFDLSAAYGYLMTLETKNIQQLPFTIDIFTSQDLRNYAYTYAPKSASFAQNYYVLPPLYPFDKGITTLLGTTSYNNSESANEVKNMSIYPLPYDYLTNIYLERQNTTAVKADLQTIPETKGSIYLYKIPSLKSDGFFILAQSYHDGWKAYRIQNSESSIQNWINTAFPFIFGTEIKDHVLVNNWENGWLLSESRVKSQESRIIIVFLPQYLEFLGFVLTFAAFVALLVRKNKKLSD